MVVVVYKFLNEFELFVYKRRDLMSKKTGMILAAAVGTLFAASAFATAATTDAAAATGAGATDANMVKCVGGNACKGTSECKTANNGCKGQNSCKGKGWVMVATDKDCTDKGGTVEAAATDATAAQPAATEAK